MDLWRRRAELAALSLAVAAAIGCGGPAPGTDSASAAEPEPAEETDWVDRYPDDVSPPEGTVYPCALTALPRDLPGVPPEDRRFVNHVYADVLAATRAKLVFLRDADAPTGPGPALDRYVSEIEAVRERIAAEKPPDGLGEFRADVVAAFELQLEAFRAASRARPGNVVRAAFARREARLASHRLRGAWARMDRRYRDAPRALRDSIYHHLCALDLF